MTPVVYALLACRPPIGLDRVGPGPLDTGDERMDCEGRGTCAVPSTSSTHIGHHDVVVADDGAAWLSWVEVDGFQALTVWLARSPSPAAALEPPIRIPVIEPPVVGSSEKPSMALRGDRMVFGYTGTGSRRHGDAHAVYVQHATVQGASATFEPAHLVDFSTQRDWVAEQARVAMADDGAWVLYKRQLYGQRDIATVAHEADGYEPTGLSDALSQDHECSPPDLMSGAGSEVYAALRSNVAGWLQTVVVRVDDPSIAPVTVTDDTWAYSDAVCPDDGPRVVRTAKGRVIVSWTAPAEDTWRMSWAASDDGGATFAEPDLHHAATERGDRHPAMVAQSDGTVMSTIQDLAGGTRLFAHSPTLALQQEAPLVAPNGQALERVELAARAGRSVAAGFDKDGRLWLVEASR